MRNPPITSEPPHFPITPVRGDVLKAQIIKIQQYTNSLHRKYLGSQIIRKVYLMIYNYHIYHLLTSFYVKEWPTTLPHMSQWTTVH